MRSDEFKELEIVVLRHELAVLRCQAGRPELQPADYVTFEALHKLYTGERAKTSWLGIALVTTSVVGMPMLGIAKRRLADTLGSVATRGEGTQNLLCAYRAAAVLLGLLGNALFGLWWLDPVAALVVAAVAVREGVASWRGEGCADLLLTKFG